MTEENEHLKQITEIRSMMERSTKFLSLSGLSGVFAGIFALGGAAWAYWRLGISPFTRDSYLSVIGESKITLIQPDLLFELVLVGLAVLFLSVGTGLLLTMRNARKSNQEIFGKAGLRMMFTLAVPLAAGGLFCLVLIHHHAYGFVAPATLLFYGMALFGAGKHTHGEIQYLGLCQIGLGIISAFYIGYGLLFWAFGFGLLHILYGLIMYFKYERNPAKA